MNHKPDPPTTKAPPDYYPTTLWTCIFLARADTEQSEEAWKTLLERYRGPIQGRIERCLKNHDPSNLVDEFISLRLCQQLVPQADRAKGRFRNLLAKALRDFIADKLRILYAKKRGQGVPDVELGTMDLERQATLAVTHDFGHDLDRDVAFRVMQRARELTRTLFLAQRAKKSTPRKASPEEEFEFLIGKTSHLSVAEIAQTLGKTQGAFKTDRSRWQDALLKNFRLEVLELVAPEEVEEEMRYLLSLLGDQPKIPPETL